MITTICYAAIGVTSLAGIYAAALVFLAGANAAGNRSEALR